MPVSEALLKVKRLKDAHDYSLMFNTPQEAPVKKPLTTSKPAMESREEHPKQSKSDSKRYNPNKHCDIDDKDDQNMEVGFNTIHAGEHHRYIISTVTCCHGWGTS